MHCEIERKFLVQGDYKSLATACYEIAQGYLSTDPDRTVRVRIQDQQGYITIKGKSDPSGITRSEWEYEIEVEQARKLLEICLATPIIKHRYIVPIEGVIVEIDEFYGAHQGLVIAEIELPTIDSPYPTIDFLAEEVTGDIRYYNSWLSQHPSAHQEK